MRQDEQGYQHELTREYIETARGQVKDIREKAEKHGIELDGLPDYKQTPLAEDINALCETLGRIQPPPLYHEIQDDSRRQFVRALGLAEPFRKAAFDWGSLPPAYQAQTLLSTARLHHKIAVPMLHEPEKLTLGLYTDAGDNKSKWRTYAYLRRKKPHHPIKIHINTHPDTGYDAFITALGRLFHESTHAIQMRYADLYDYGTLKPGDPLYDTAQYWSSIWENAGSIYLKGKINAAYKAHPLETDAFARQSAFKKELFTALLQAGTQ